MYSLLFCAVILNIIILKDPTWNDDPLQLQQKRCHNQTARVGQNVTFLCSFYAGVDVSQTSVSWRRPNVSLPEEDWSSCGHGSDWLGIGEIQEISPFTAYHTRQIVRDARHVQHFNDTPSISSMLMIVNVSEETFGLYCVIANNDGRWSRDILMLSPLDEEQISPHNYHELTVVVVASSFVLVVVSFLLWKIVALDMKLWYHSHYGDNEQNDGLLYDAYISYSWTDQDRQFVLNVIMPYLEGFGYRLFFPEIHTVPSNVLLEELRRAMELSRRCIMLITPSYIVSEFGKFEVELATDIMSSKLSKRIIPVLFGVCPHTDPSPLYGSEPSMSSASSSSSPSLTSSSQATSVSSDSQNDISYPSASEASQGASPSVLSSCSTSSSTPSVFLPHPIKINFNFSPLLGQLVKVLKPLKTKRKEPSKLCNHKRFLKKLRLRMPKPPSRDKNSMVHQNVETVSHTSDLVENEVLPDGSGEDMGIRMEIYPRLYPVAPNNDV